MGRKVVYRSETCHVNGCSSAAIASSKYCAAHRRLLYRIRSSIAGTVKRALARQGKASKRRSWSVDDFSPLHRAAKDGHTKWIRELIQSGVNVNALDHSGRTPLDYAIQKGHKKAARALREAGAKEAREVSVTQQRVTHDATVYARWAGKQVSVTQQSDAPTSGKAALGATLKEKSDNLKAVESRLATDRSFAEVTVSRNGENLRSWLPPLSSEERAEALRVAHAALSSHRLNQLIQEAAQIADREIRLEYAASIGAIVSQCSHTLGTEPPIVSTIEKALEIAPNDPDLLFAKSEAYCLILDNKRSQEVRRKVLAIAPDHFDANMREKHFQQWDHMFCYPGWYESTTVVPSVMLELQQEGKPVQIVRDGLKLTLAILMPTSRDQFPKRILESRWKPLLAETPFGPIFVHYLMLKPDRGAIHRQELMISPYPVKPVHPRHGNWLIHRFCNVSSIFLAFNDGKEVLYNRRYVFPPKLREELASIEKKLHALKLPPDHERRAQSAVNWYMQNSNIDDVEF